MKTLTINRARTLANIAARAQSLFARGYTYRPLGASRTLFTVAPPANLRRRCRAGVPMPDYIVDIAAQTCTCEAFRRYAACKHEMAVEEEEGRAAWAEDEYERSGRAEYETFGKYL